MSDDPFKAFDSAMSEIGEVDLAAVVEETKGAAPLDANMADVVRRVDGNYGPERLCEVVDTIINDGQGDERYPGGYDWPPVGTVIVLRERAGFGRMWKITMERTS